MGKEKQFLKDLDDLPEDIFVENERGVSLLGYPFYSARLLIPRIDPTNYQIINTENRVLRNISNSSVHSIAGMYPLTRDEARHGGEGPSKWFVLMAFKDKLDMDDQGWLYSWHFNTERWKSKHGFVRRRVWVKLPEIDSPVTGESDKIVSVSMSPSTHHSNSEECLISELSSQLLDRTRFELLDTRYKSGELTQESLRNEQFCNRLRDCFEYTSSKQKFQKIWLPGKS